MTAKDQADDLFREMLLELDWNGYEPSTKKIAKKCAFIAVDRIIEEVAESADDEVKFMRIIYWERVKREINNL
jgi:hypothetical protein